MTDLDFKTLHNEFKIIEKKIKEYNTIIIYRHVSPDLDALGSQCGLYYWIKENFKDKEVYMVGDININLIPSIFPEPNIINKEILEKEHLAITIDVSDYKRIAENNIKLAKEVIKIDHHELPKEEDRFGDYIFIHPDFPSASEIISLFCLSRSKKYIISLNCAKYLYAGIIGDTNRFLYPATNSATLRIASSLLDIGFNKDELYNQIYQIDLRRLNILSYTLNNYKVTQHGTAYIIFGKDTLKKLNMESYEGNNYLDNLRNLENVHVILSLTYNEVDNNYKISFRSKNISILEVANKYNGGGHKFASGGRLSSLKELNKLLFDCDNLINSNTQLK